MRSSAAGCWGWDNTFRGPCVRSRFRRRPQLPLPRGCSPPVNRPLILLCFLIVYLVWGSTYLANAYAVDSIPPALVSCVRFLIAGGLMWGIARFRGADFRLDRSAWRAMAVAGTLFLGIGVGVVVWALQYIDSNVVAILISLEPLLVILLLWAWKKERPRWTSYLGIALGIAGSVMLVQQDLVVTGALGWWAVGAIFFGMTAWGAGMIYLRDAPLPPDRYVSTGGQMLIGGLLLLPFALLDERTYTFSVQQVLPASWWAMGFLVVFGSLIAYSAYNYLLVHVATEKVASTTYVHPVVAIVLGCQLRDELITPWTLLATAVILSGVVFINFGDRLGRKV